MVPETLVNVLLALLPRAVMAVMHTTIIRASMTAYSTAVGPSSRFRNSATFCSTFFIALLLSAAWRSAGSQRGAADPWLCAPALRRVSRFEDSLPPPNPSGSGYATNLGHKSAPVKRGKFLLSPDRPL